MIIEIVRIKSSKTLGTIGTVKVDGSMCYWSLELGYRNNEANVSSIPLGTYKVTNHQSPKFGSCLAVHNVPGRNDILIHTGNTITDTKGCILIGDGVQDTTNGRTVTNSKAALANLLNKTKNEKEITLKVTEL